MRIRKQATETPLFKKTQSVDSLTITPELRNKMIAEAAYYIAEQNEFNSDPIQDWLLAESQINSRLGR